MQCTTQQVSVVNVAWIDDARIFIVENNRRTHHALNVDSALNTTPSQRNNKTDAYHPLAHTEHDSCSLCARSTHNASSARGRQHTKCVHMKRISAPPHTNSYTHTYSRVHASVGSSSNYGANATCPFVWHAGIKNRLWRRLLHTCSCTKRFDYHQVIRCDSAAYKYKTQDATDYYYYYSGRYQRRVQRSV